MSMYVYECLIVRKTRQREIHDNFQTVQLSKEFFVKLSLTTSAEIRK